VSGILKVSGAKEIKELGEIKMGNMTIHLQVTAALRAQEISKLFLDTLVANKDQSSRDDQRRIDILQAAVADGTIKVLGE
jgi:hypothetical protein